MAAREAGVVPTVAVVIPTSGKREILDEVAAAVLADAGTSELVIVLDESSPTAAGDRLLERFTALDPRVRTMRTPAFEEDLLSLQVARDAGAAFAESEVILSLDDDVILEPSAVAGHAHAHAGAERQVVLGYMPVVSREKWPRSSATIRFYSEAYEHTCDLYEADPGTILRQLWCGNLSLRRADWLAAIDRPRLRCWGHDDQELGLLFLREGLQGKIDRSLRGGHWYARSLPAFVERAERSLQGQAKLRAANPDLLEEPQLGGGRRERISGPVLWLARSALGWLAVRKALIALVSVTGALKLRAVEDPAARYLWFLAGERSRRQGPLVSE
jgi:glycosyltransferase involved in cell wall biosynthesis